MQNFFWGSSHESGDHRFLLFLERKDDAISVAVILRACEWYRKTVVQCKHSEYVDARNRLLKNGECSEYIWLKPPPVSYVKGYNFLKHMFHTNKFPLPSMKQQLVQVMSSVSGSATEWGSWLQIYAAAIYSHAPLWRSYRSTEVKRAIPKLCCTL